MKIQIRKFATLAMATVSLAALALGFSAQNVGAASVPSLRAENVPTWWYQAPTVPEAKVDLARMFALKDVKVALRIQVRVASVAFPADESNSSSATRT